MLFLFALLQAQPLHDFHLHTLSPGLAKVFNLVRSDMEFVPMGTQELQDLVTPSGVDQGVIISAAYLIGMDVPGVPDFVLRKLIRNENDWIVEQAVASQGRFRPFCGININWEFALEEAERCLEAGGQGIKVHLQYEDTSVVDNLEVMDSLYKTMARFGVPGLIHPPLEERGQTWSLFKLSLANPKTVIVWAHALSDGVRSIERYAMFYKNWGSPRNLFLDLSHVLSFYRGAPVAPQILWTLRQFGTDYLVWGSDVFPTPPMSNGAKYRAWVEDVQGFGFDASELGAITQGNFIRIFQLAQELRSR